MLSLLVRRLITYINNQSLIVDTGDSLTSSQDKVNYFKNNGEEEGIVFVVLAGVKARKKLSLFTK